VHLDAHDRARNPVGRDVIHGINAVLKSDHQSRSVRKRASRCDEDVFVSVLRIADVERGAHRLRTVFGTTIRSEYRSNALAGTGKGQLGPTVKPARVVFRGVCSHSRTATLCGVIALADAFFPC